MRLREPTWASTGAAATVSPRGARVFVCVGPYDPGRKRACSMFHVPTSSVGVRNDREFQS